MGTVTVTTGIEVWQEGTWCHHMCMSHVTIHVQQSRSRLLHIVSLSDQCTLPQCEAASSPLSLLSLHLFQPHQRQILACIQAVSRT